MTVRWVIPSTGVYTIVVQATHGNDDGSDRALGIGSYVAVGIHGSDIRGEVVRDISPVDGLSARR
jgi:hypothetical protein